MLETIYLKFRKPIVQRVTVVKFGVYNGGGNCFCGVKVKVGTDTAESTNVMVAGFKQCRYLLRKRKEDSKISPTKYMTLCCSIPRGLEQQRVSGRTTPITCG